METEHIENWNHDYVDSIPIGLCFQLAYGLCASRFSSTIIHLFVYLFVPKSWRAGYRRLIDSHGNIWRRNEQTKQKCAFSLNIRIHPTQNYSAVIAWRLKAVKLMLQFEYVDVARYHSGIASDFTIHFAFIYISTMQNKRKKKTKKRFTFRCATTDNWQRVRKR